MGLHFKLGKHGLPVDRPLEAFQILVQQGHPAVRLITVFQQLLDHQVFVNGRGNFRDKHRIVRQVGRLGMVGQPGMHGMPHLMGNRRNTLQCAGIVQKDIRGRIIGAGGIGPAGLALVRIHIDPAFTESSLYGIDIIFPQNGNSLQHHFLCLVIAVFVLRAFRQRCVEVIVMQFIHAQQLLSESDVPMHDIHMIMDGGDQLVIDRCRDIVLGHGHLA